MSRPYQPSNGREGMWFTDKFCWQCIHCDPDPLGEKQCDILQRTLIFSIGDADYPKEWIYDEANNPVCTDWVKWDWGRDGDPDDPNQLVLPFDIIDILGSDIIQTKIAVLEPQG